MKRLEMIRNPLLNICKNLLLFFFGFAKLEYCFDNVIYSLYKSLGFFFHIKSLKHPQLKKQLRSITKECTRQKREIIDIIYSNHQKLNKLNSLMVGFCSACLGIVITIVGTVFFANSVKNNFFLVVLSGLFVIFGLILTVVVSVLLSLIVFYAKEYSDQNNCYIITPSYIYHISKEWNIIWNIIELIGQKIGKNWNYSKVQCRWFEMKYIYQAECYVPSSYQFCEMNNIGVVKMYVNHTEYINEIQAAEKEEKQRSNIGNFTSKITTMHSQLGNKVAPFEIYGVPNPTQTVENINLLSRIQRKEL